MISCELIATVFSDDPLEVIHSKEIRVIPTGSLKSDRESSVQHLVITLVEQGGSKIWLIRIGDI